MLSFVLTRNVATTDVLEEKAFYVCWKCSNIPFKVTASVFVCGELNILDTEKKNSFTLAIKTFV